MNDSPIQRFRAVRASYRRTREALKIAHRSLRTDRLARRTTHFSGLADPDFDDEFLGMQRRLDDATVLTLWVIFERFIVEHVTASWPRHIARPLAFEARLHDKARREIERWRFEDLLDLYKGWVDSDALGHVKQLKGYRDWVAHRNPRKAPAAAFAPDRAYRALTSVVRTVEGEPGGNGPES